jgi:putative restriction endonuclease
MSSTDEDIAIRIVAISHIEARTRASPNGTLTWSEIEDGFEFRGQLLHLANRTRGIFWPSPLRSGALSIKTVIPPTGTG